MGRVADHIEQLKRRGKLDVRAANPLPGHLTASNWLVLLLASLGIGFFPIGPATLASGVVALAAYFAGSNFGWFEWLLMVLAATALSVPLGRATQRILQREDPRLFIVDEVAGQALVFVFFAPTLSNCLWGFLFFRIFDVVKLPPADRLESLPGGWGIVADDLAAGLYATLAVLLMNLVIPGRVV